MKPIALITGGATRLGATIARHLHHAGYDLVVHYRQSEKEAQQLKNELEDQRPDSVYLWKADLFEPGIEHDLIEAVLSAYGRLDLLINNASSFFMTPFGQIIPEDWQELFYLNAQLPFFLAQACAPSLKKSGGSIINLVDIHACRPLFNHSVYSMAKAANAMMVKSLALELAPEVRVNGIAPGAILWPKQSDESEQNLILKRIPLKRTGSPKDIAETVLFLAQAQYITGQIIPVDGGRTVQQ